MRVKFLLLVGPVSVWNLHAVRFWINRHLGVESHFGETKMKEVGISWARANFYTLLKEVACGETIIITRRGRPVARLTAPEVPDREAAVAAAKTLRSLRQRIGWATTEDILQMRDAGRRCRFMTCRK